MSHTKPRYVPAHTSWRRQAGRAFLLGTAGLSLAGAAQAPAPSSSETESEPWYRLAAPWAPPVQALLIAPTLEVPTAPSFAAPMTNPFGLGNVFSDSSPTFVDIDDDGDMDAFIGDIYGALFYFENTGSSTTPTFAAPVSNPFGLTGVNYRSSPTFVDLDDDGDQDLLIGDYDGNLNYFENTGSTTTPTFAAVVSNPFGLADIGRYASPAFADLDNDGDQDLLVGDYDGNFKYFQNTGSNASPAFAAVVDNPFGLTSPGITIHPFFTDLDGDTDQDLMVGIRGGNWMYFENTGSISAPAFAAPATNPFGLIFVSPRSRVAFADIDGDGDFDAFTGERFGDTIYFENTETSLPIELADFSALVEGNGVLLAWQTASETNNAGFEVQHQVDGAWEAKGFVQGAGTTVTQQSYQHSVEAIQPGHHVFRLKQVDLNGAFAFSDELEITVDVPVTLTLAQNYPNPFNPSTEIAFSVPTSGHARLSVYTLDGREVATLFNQTANADQQYSVSFDATDQPSGLFLYALEFNGQRTLRTMMLVK